MDFRLGVLRSVLNLQGEGLAIVTVDDAVIEPIAKYDEATVECTRTFVVHESVNARVLSSDLPHSILVTVVIVLSIAEDDSTKDRACKHGSDKSESELHDC
jgi:sulfur transfer complex TusBCD TusB component (DsrH family)